MSCALGMVESTLKVYIIIIIIIIYHTVQGNLKRGTIISSREVQFSLLSVTKRTVYRD